MKAKKLAIFMLLAYISAFFFEELPRAIFIELFHHPHMKHLWQIQGIVVFFFLWYGTIFIIFYSLFAKKTLKLPVTFGIILGMLAETFLFKQMNVVSFFLFPFLYGGMFYCPFKLIQKYKC